MDRKAAKIRNQYSQVPHLTQDTKWESDKSTIKHHKQKPMVSPFSPNNVALRHDQRLGISSVWSVFAVRMKLGSHWAQSKYSAQTWSVVWCASHWLCGVLCLSLFCCALPYVLSNFAITLQRKRKLVALLLLSYGCLVTVNVLDSSTRWHGLVCGVWLWYFLITIT